MLETSRLTDCSVPAAISLMMALQELGNLNIYHPKYQRLDLRLQRAYLELKVFAETFPSIFKSRLYVVEHQLIFFILVDASLDNMRIFESVMFLPSLSSLSLIQRSGKQNSSVLQRRK